MNEPDWRDAVVDMVRRLVSDVAAVEFAAAWADHAHRDKVEVTFLGPYSSGKSSVLRRLVADAGVDTPHWLTVSARRETFELNEVAVGELTFTDAPGFAAGNELHNRLAEDALALSDAFLLVVPPQLLTSNRDLVASILSGSYFFDEPTPVEHTAIAVVAQVDTMGVDPDDDPDGMQALAARKRGELKAQLEDAAGVSLLNLQVLSVAADPYEAQSRSANPQRADFDEFRDWDGIGVLETALAALTGRKDELRRAAGFRYFARLGSDVLKQAAVTTENLRAYADDMQSRRDRWSQLKTRTDAVIESAKGQLTTVLVDLEGELTGELVGGDENSQAELEKRMSAALEGWAQKWNAELGVLLSEAELEIDERMAKPGALRTEAFLRSIAERDPAKSARPAPAPNSRVVGLLGDIEDQLQGVARDAFEVLRGQPMEDALSVAKKLAAANQSAKRLTKSLEVSERAIASASKLEPYLLLASSIMDVVSQIDRSVQTQRAEVDVVRRKAARHGLVERNAALTSTQIVDGAPGEEGWRARADEALRALRDRSGLPEELGAVDELVEDVAERERLLHEFRGLLALGGSLARQTPEDR